MRTKLEINEEDFLRIYQEDISDEALEKFIDTDPVFGVFKIILNMFLKKSSIISKIQKNENEIKEIQKEDMRNMLVREFINCGFKKIEKQGYVVDKIIVSPIIKTIMKSIEDDNGDKIMERDKFWTAIIKTEQKTKSIIFLSSYFEKKEKQEHQVYM